MSMETATITKEALRKIFSEGKRFDSRKLDKYRDLKVSLDVANTAEGSCRVILGKTEVIVGVKLALDKPYPDSKDKGNLSVSADLLPMASPRYEVGPPKFDAIELPRLVDRVIRESHVIKLDEMCIKAGEKVWTVMIDIYPINSDGNLVDAATIGATIALKNSNIPGIEDDRADYKHRTKKKLPLHDNVPLSITFYKLGESIITDPTREEEEACDTKVTFGVSKSSKGKYMIHSCQKGKETPFSQKEVELMADMLPALYDQLIEKLKKFL